MLKRWTGTVLSVCLLCFGPKATAQTPVLGQPPAEMDRLRFMEGGWEVQTYEPDEAGEWRATIRTPFIGTTIMNGSMVQTEGEVSFGKGASATARFIWSFDQFHGTFRVVVLDDGYGYIDVLEGEFDGDRLVLTNRDTGTYTTDGNGRDHVLRFTLEEMGADAYCLTAEFSNREGKSWARFSRMEFRRTELPGT